VSYFNDKDSYLAVCEVWTVDNGNQTMRSDPLPKSGQHNRSGSGPIDPSNVSSFVSDDCANTTQTS